MSMDGITYSYIGRASLVSVQQSSANALGETGKSTYSAYWPGDIVVALPAKTNGTTTLLGYTRSGDTWTIEVHKGNGSVDANGFDIEEATEVYCFGAPAPTADSIIMLYNVNGVPCADLTRRPLTFAARIVLPANVTDWAPPVATSVPAVLGWPSDRLTTSSGSGFQVANNTFGRGWQLSPTGHLVRNPYLMFRHVDDFAFQSVDQIRPLNAILIEAAGL